MSMAGALLQRYLNASGETDLNYVRTPARSACRAVGDPLGGGVVRQLPDDRKH
jgi:hypothetical protein